MSTPGKRTAGIHLVVAGAAVLWGLPSLAAPSGSRRGTSTQARPPRVTVFWFIKSKWRARTDVLVRQLEEGLEMDERIRFLPFQRLIYPPKEAEVLVTQAKELDARVQKALFELDLDQALQAAKKAAIAYRDALWYLATRPEGPAPLVDALGRLASVAHQVGDTKLRRKALSLLLSLKPKWQPPKDAPEGLGEAVMDLRLEQQEFGAAPLKIASRPNAAEVYLDGQRVGRTPLELKDVPVGWHFVTFLRRGFKPVTKSVNVAPETGGSLEVALELVSKPLWEGLKTALGEMGRPVAGPGIRRVMGLLDVDALCLARVVLHGSEAVLTLVAYSRKTRRVLGRPLVKKVDLNDVSVDVAGTVSALVERLLPRPQPKRIRKPKKKRPSPFLVRWRRFRRWKGFWYVWGGVGGLVLVGAAVGLGVGLGMQARTVRPGAARRILFLRPGRSALPAARVPGFSVHW